VFGCSRFKLFTFVASLLWSVFMRYNVTHNGSSSLLLSRLRLFQQRGGKTMFHFPHNYTINQPVKPIYTLL
jgi:hypothetical protein